jgi:hypothetical protein
MAACVTQCLQDYFRDITREDLLELLPAYPDPSQDPAFLVPLLGRPHDAPAPEAGGFGSAPDSAAGRSQAQVHAKATVLTASSVGGLNELSWQDAYTPQRCRQNHCSVRKLLLLPCCRRLRRVRPLASSMPRTW